MIFFFEIGILKLLAAGLFDGNDDQERIVGPERFGNDLPILIGFRAFARGNRTLSVVEIQIELNRIAKASQQAYRNQNGQPALVQKRAILSVLGMKLRC